MSALGGTTGVTDADIRIGFTQLGMSRDEAERHMWIYAANGYTREDLIAMAAGEMELPSLDSKVNQPAPGGGGGGFSPDTALPATGGGSAADGPAATGDVMSLYPQFGAWINHPELGSILKEAAAAGWDATRLEGAIHNTNWWKSTWPQLREWQYVTSRDPGAAAKARERATYETDTMLDRLGINLPDHVRGSLVEGYLGHGRDEWYLQKRIGDLLRKDHSLIGNTGELAANKNQIIQRGAQYLVGVDPGTATSWAIDQWSGAKSQQWFDSYYADQAKKRFTWLGDEIDAGTTPAEWYAPVVSSVAQQLERDPTSINLMSPEWQDLLEVYDEGEGKIRPRTMGEAVRWARKQEAYRFTQGAQDRASEVSEFLLRTFGKA